MALHLPGASDRTVVIGPTGSGKTVGGAWILSRQNLNARPWVCLDFKREELWEMVGFPPIKDLDLGVVPKRPGLYRMTVQPNEDDPLEAWLWKIWTKGNVGIFVDEVSLMPRRGAFKAILRQGRSLRIPVIACTQRPVDCDREIFSESQFRMLYGVEDPRDWLIIRGLFRHADVEEPLPPFYSYWYDAKRKSCVILEPTPAPEEIASDLRMRAPHGWTIFGA